MAGGLMSDVPVLGEYLTGWEGRRERETEGELCVVIGRQLGRIGNLCLSIAGYLYLPRHSS